MSTRARNAGPGTARHTRPGRRAAAVCGLLLAAALAVTGCGSSGGGDSSSSDAAPAQHSQGGGDARAAAPGGSGTGAATPGTTGSGTGGSGGGTGTGSTGGSGGSGRTPAVPALPTYLARTARLTVRTPHVERQLDAARALAAAAGGYAGDEDTTVDTDGHAQSTLQLRVPAAAYDGLLVRLAGLGTLVDRTVQVEDVTGQVVDVRSRIRSQQASVARVRALMDRASDLNDVVSLESELSTRESALESLEAQQDALASRTDLATISLHLVEPPAKPARHPAAAKHDGFWTAVGHGLRDGWHGLSVTLRALLVAAAVVLPFAAPALLLWSGYRLLRRRLPGGRAAGRMGDVSLRAPDGRAAGRRAADGGAPLVPSPGLPAYPGAAAEEPATGDAAPGPAGPASHGSGPAGSGSDGPPAAG